MNIISSEKSIQYKETLSKLIPIDLNENSREYKASEEFNNMSSYYNTLESEKHKNDENYVGKDIYENKLDAIIDELVADPTLYAKILNSYEYVKPKEITDEQKEFYDIIKTYYSKNNWLQTYLNFNKEELSINLTGKLYKYITNNEVNKESYELNINGKATKSDAGKLIGGFDSFNKGITSKDRIKWLQENDLLSEEEKSEEINSNNENASNNLINKLDTTQQPQSNNQYSNETGSQEEFIFYNSKKGYELGQGFIPGLIASKTKFISLGVKEVKVIKKDPKTKKVITENILDQPLLNKDGSQKTDKQGNLLYKQKPVYETAYVSNNKLSNIMKNWNTNPGKELREVRILFEKSLYDAIKENGVRLNDIHTLKLDSSEIIINNERYNFGEQIYPGMELYQLIDWNGSFIGGLHKYLINLEICSDYFEAIYDDCALSNKYKYKENIKNSSIAFKVCKYLLELKFKNLKRLQISDTGTVVDKTTLKEWEKNLVSQESSSQSEQKSAGEKIDNNIQQKQYKRSLGQGLADLFSGRRNFRNSYMYNGGGIYDTFRGGRTNRFRNMLTRGGLGTNYGYTPLPMRVLGVLGMPFQFIGGIFSMLTGNGKGGRNNTTNRTNNFGGNYY